MIYRKIPISFFGVSQASERIRKHFSLLCFYVLLALKRLKFFKFSVCLGVLRVNRKYINYFISSVFVSGLQEPAVHLNFQFNFVSFDDLVPYLPRFRQTFPNVENFEFIETDIRSLNQLNALALVQGITSLNVNPDGNPISVKGSKYKKKLVNKQRN